MNSNPIIQGVSSPSAKRCPASASYLREVRGIDLAVASPYLRHIRYEVGGREYSAIGFPNRAGGYELRGDKTFKGTIAPKDISVIAGRASNAPLCIFEGFVDFLSLLTMKGEETISPSIVLNSVSNIHRAVAYLHENGIDSVRHSSTTMKQDEKPSNLFAQQASR